MSMVRLQKYLAECGIASRRKSEDIIAKGLVKVNGDIVTELGTKIDPAVDKVEFINNLLIPLKPEKKVYLMLNKPVGYVTTLDDEKGRSTVMDLLKGVELLGKEDLLRGHGRNDRERRRGLRGRHPLHGPRYGPVCRSHRTGPREGAQIRTETQDLMKRIILLSLISACKMWTDSKPRST